MTMKNITASFITTGVCLLDRNAIVLPGDADITTDTRRSRGIFVPLIDATYDVSSPATYSID
jgi:hypothetical protein